MSQAEVYMAMHQRCQDAVTFAWSMRWSEAADEIAYREELAGNGETFWSEVDRIEKEN